MADVRENRVRRAVERRGLVLVKIFRFDRTAPGHGKYLLVDPRADQLLTLDEVERQLGIEP